MRNYVEIETPMGNTIIQYEENGVLYSIPKDLGNSDYQAYLKRDEPKVEHLTEIPTEQDCLFAKWNNRVLCLRHGHTYTNGTNRRAVT